MRFNKTVSYAVSFGKFCQENRIPAYDVGELVTLALRAHAAGTRAANSDDYRNDEVRTKTSIQTKAESLGFKVVWYGLWPTLQTDGHDVNLPSPS